MGDERHLRDLVDFALEDFDQVAFAIVIDPESDLAPDLATAESRNWEADLGRPLTQLRRTATTLATYLSSSAEGGPLILVTSAEVLNDAPREQLQRQAISIAVQAFATDLSNLGVRVNAVLRVPDSRPRAQASTSRTALSDGTDDVVSAALWLSSHEALTLSGVTIPVGPPAVRDRSQALVRG